MSNLVVEMSEMARQITAQLDTRAAKLELLIKEADEKIARLGASGESTSGNGAPVDANHGPRSPAYRAGSAVHAGSRRSASRAGLSTGRRRPIQSADRPGTEPAQRRDRIDPGAAATTVSDRFARPRRRRYNAARGCGPQDSGDADAGGDQRLFRGGGVRGRRSAAVARRGRRQPRPGQSRLPRYQKTPRVLSLRHPTGRHALKPGPGANPSRSSAASSTACCASCESRCATCRDLDRAGAGDHTCLHIVIGEQGRRPGPSALPTGCCPSSPCRWRPSRWCSIR